MASKPRKPNNSPEITAQKRADGKDLGGRPRFEIDYKTLETLCGIFCIGEECASVLGCSYETLNLRLQQDYQEAFEEINAGRGENEDLEQPSGRYNGFKECFKKSSALGKASLRREQYNMAVGAGRGNRPDKGMLIWMGKNYLEQTDRFDHTTAGEQLPGPQETAFDFTLLGDDEFEAFGRLLNKATLKKTTKIADPKKNVH